MNATVTMPSVFISHGTPMLALAEDDYTEALQSFARQWPQPKAIVAVSAHGLAPDGLVEITAGNACQVVHDFRGFPHELYEMNYPCPGAPKLSAEIASMLVGAGFQTTLSSTSRIDHGVWIPLKVAYPEANIPVIQVAMPFPGDPRLILKMGKALSALRHEGVLLLGSGGTVHNLQRLNWPGKFEEAEPWVREFEEWVKKQLISKNVEALVNFEEEAPSIDLAHPTVEHFLPILFTVGAALPGDQAIPIFEGVQYGSLSMLSFFLSDRISPVA